MNKRNLRIFGLIVIVGLLGLSLWFILKPYDYRITFKSKAHPGIINQSLKLWIKSERNSEFLESESLENIKQSYQYEDANYVYDWTFESKNDSLTVVNVGIIDSTSSISNRIAHIFKDTKLKNSAIQNVSDFMEVLQAHLDSHDVKIVGEAMSPEVFCAYLSFETEQMLKANEMMKNYTYLSNELLKNKIELDGNPMVEILEWNQKTDSIKFNFCFPIIKTDSLPSHKEIKFKRIESKKSIKAVYHGNYISSDRAWYRLIQYSKNNNLNLIKKAVEVYHNNPNYGSDERNWKTEIYMPIKN